MRVALENGRGFLGGNFGVCVEEEILDPSNVAVWADPFASVSKRVWWARTVLLVLGLSEELLGLRFQLRRELGRNAVVDDLEESELPAGLGHGGGGAGVGEVDDGDSGEEGWAGLAGFDGREMVYLGL